jgi:DnaJ-class molecular chaperone
MMIELSRECKACKGKCVQKRNDGIKIECPSCKGEGIIYASPNIEYQSPKLSEWSTQPFIVWDSAPVLDGNVQNCYLSH